MSIYMAFCILFSLREIWREKSLNAGDRTVSWVNRYMYGRDNLTTSCVSCSFTVKISPLWPITQSSTMLLTWRWFCKQDKCDCARIIFRVTCCNRSRSMNLNKCRIICNLDNAPPSIYRPVSFPGLRAWIHCYSKMRHAALQERDPFRNVDTYSSTGN